MRSGVILAFALVTKKQELFDTMADKYNILCKGSKIYTNLSEEEYFDAMEDLASQFYEQGSPKPEEINTEIIGD